jgi:hypothetical protein
MRATHKLSRPNDATDVMEVNGNLPSALLRPHPTPPRPFRSLAVTQERVTVPQRKRFRCLWLAHFPVAVEDNALTDRSLAQHAHFASGSGRSGPVQPAPADTSSPLILNPESPVVDGHLLAVPRAAGLQPLRGHGQRGLGTFTRFGLFLREGPKSGRVFHNDRDSQCQARDCDQSHQAANGESDSQDRRSPIFWLIREIRPLGFWTCISRTPLVSLLGGMVTSM